MEVNKFLELSQFGEITSFIGDIKLDSSDNIYPKTRDNTLLVRDELSKLGPNEKIEKAIKVVDLDNSVLDKKFGELSTGLINKLAIVEALLENKNEIIFKDINKGLKFRECENVKRLLLKFIEHNKKIIILNNDIEFLFKLSKHVFVALDNLAVKEFNPVNWLEESIYEYVSKPPIIEFVMYLKSRNIKIDDCYETKELLKAIYRSVDK